VTFTRGVALVVLALYVFLWVLAVNGVSSLVPVLAVPLVLALLVAFGVWLNRFMGVTPRRPRFEERRHASDASDVDGVDSSSTPPSGPSLGEGSPDDSDRESGQ
jgi:hypothetical protein